MMFCFTWFVHTLVSFVRESTQSRYKLLLCFPGTRGQIITKLLLKYSKILCQVQQGDYYNIHIMIHAKPQNKISIRQVSLNDIFSRRNRSSLSVGSRSMLTCFLIVSYYRCLSFPLATQDVIVKVVFNYDERRVDKSFMENQKNVQYYQFFYGTAPTDRIDLIVPWGTLI